MKQVDQYSHVFSDNFLMRTSLLNPISSTQTHLHSILNMDYHDYFIYQWLNMLHILLIFRLSCYFIFSRNAIWDFWLFSLSLKQTNNTTISTKLVCIFWSIIKMFLSKPFWSTFLQIKLFFTELSPQTLKNREFRY